MIEYKSNTASSKKCLKLQSHLGTRVAVRVRRYRNCAKTLSRLSKNKPNWSQIHAVGVTPKRSKKKLNSEGESNEEKTLALLRTI